MHGNGDEIDFDVAVRGCHAGTSYAWQIAIEGAEDGAQNDGDGLLTVLAGGQAIGCLKGAGERLVGGKAVIQRDGKDACIGIPQRFERKGQGTKAQVIAKGHTGKLPELSGKIGLRISKELGKPPQGHGLILLVFDALDDLACDALNLFVPLVRRPPPSQSAYHSGIEECLS